MNTIAGSKPLLREALEVWGKQAQFDMLHEEIGEMMQALNKWKRNPNEETLDHFAEELTDVEILLGEMKTMLPEDRLEFWQDFKLGRMRKRLDKTKQERKENYERALQASGTRFELFKILADKGALCTDGDMDEIMQAVIKELKVVDPEEVKG